jgi:hypothetical protein
MTRRTPFYSAFVCCMFASIAIASIPTDLVVQYCGVYCSGKTETSETSHLQGCLKDGRP